MDSPQESRFGRVALVGWTNVGKSTLLNRLVGDKIAAVADVAQTTRHRIVGVLTVPDRGQVVFVDTPGFHRPRSRMNRAMVDAARDTLRDSDVVLFLIDAERGIGPGDRRAAEILQRIGPRRILLLNKVDRVRPKERLLPLMEEAASLGFDEVRPISARNGSGCAELLDRLFEILPEGAPAYPTDYLTDQTDRGLAEEWIREQLLHRTREEIPHATAVIVEGWDEQEGGAVTIDATILVERESQKPIVIGQGGSMLKRLGTAARLELEKLLDRRVHLRVWVKIRRDWRNDDQVLRRLGFEDRSGREPGEAI